MLTTAKVKIGYLDRRVTLYSPVETVQGNGERVITWTSQGDRWAKVDFPKTGNDERFMADQQVAETRTNFTLRYESAKTATEGWMIEYDGFQYDVRNILEEGRNAYLVFQCEKRV